MTMTMTVPTTAPTAGVGRSEDRCVLVHDPRPGMVVELVPGSRLGVRFRRGVGVSRWQVAELPGHLLPLTADGHEFQFLVFAAAESTPLRLERRHPERDIVHEVCELLVVPVSDAGARTSRSASRRSA